MFGYLEAHVASPYLERTVKYYSGYLNKSGHKNFHCYRNNFLKCQCNNKTRM